MPRFFLYIIIFPHSLFSFQRTKEYFKVHQVFAMETPVMFKIKKLNGNIIPYRFYRQQLHKIPCSLRITKAIK